MNFEEMKNVMKYVKEYIDKEKEVKNKLLEVFSRYGEKEEELLKLNEKCLSLLKNKSSEDIDLVFEQVTKLKESHKIKHESFCDTRGIAYSTINVGKYLNFDSKKVLFQTNTFHYDEDKFKLTLTKYQKLRNLEFNPDYFYLSEHNYQLFLHDLLEQMLIEIDNNYFDYKLYVSDDNQLKQNILTYYHDFDIRDLETSVDDSDQIIEILEYVEVWSKFKFVLNQTERNYETIILALEHEIELTTKIVEEIESM